MVRIYRKNAKNVDDQIEVKGTAGRDMNTESGGS